MDFGGKRVAVLDTIHGGETICHKLQHTGIDAVAIDIYKNPPRAAAIDDYDVVVAPIHAKSPLLTRADKNGIPILTHHEVVGQLARQSQILKDALVFEITGVKGKTTTAALLQRAFSEKPLVSLTSRGLEARESGRYVAKKRLSITPANVLVALDLIDEFGLSPEVCIFETSLGGIGIGDVNILTTLSPEYAIAQGDRTSTEAKLQMISNAKAGSCLIAPSAVAARAPSACVNSIGDAGATVYYEEGDGREVRIRFDALRRMHGDQVSGELSFTPTGCYDLVAYRTPLLCFVTAALTAHIEAAFIERVLLSFKGVKGRLSATVIKQRTLVDNSNSGLDEASIMRAIDFGLTFKKPGHKAVLIIGEEAKNICDGMIPDVVASVANNEAFENIVLVGERMHVSTARVRYREDLKSALSAAVELTSEHDVIISCVKTWR
ncbi:MAG: coenzyme F430 synthase [Halobacteriota archaeon]